MKRSRMFVFWLGSMALLLPSLASAQGLDSSGSSATGSADVAQNTDIEDSKKTQPTGAPDPASARPSNAEATPPAQKRALLEAKDEPAEPAIAEIGVQRVPPSGYPSDVTRGLYGGSLWLGFHGLQWPYMPKKPGEPALMLGFGGYGWVDTSYVTIKSGTPSDFDTKQLRQQGRFVLRATPTYRKQDWFVQGQVELVANGDQDQGRNVNPDTDDLWVRAGKWNAFDVQVGRFEAWEVYHLGMGLDLNTRERFGAVMDGSTHNPEDFYGATYMYGRPSGSTGNVAGHVYFAPWLRLEALTRLGNSLAGNILGERGALIFDVGWFKAKVAGEFMQGKPPSSATQTHFEQKGVGGALQFIIAPHVEFGANAGYGMTDNWDAQGSLNERGTWSKYSMGGFANVRIVEELLAGGGVNYTHFRNAHADPNTGLVGESEQTQLFGAVQYGLWRQLFLKLVVGYADANFISNAFDNTVSPPFHRKMLSGRLRASFYF